MQVIEAPLAWRRSQACASTACVEIAEQLSAFFVRDSKDTDGSVLKFQRADWGSFIAGIRANALEAH
ncbi:DUF397 domain-containing protein [Dactylosporangium siamense]|uniref:DUF397 domain-containing protein n=1 Tax=Dactylosporangium siamense TaxID=685454 RepID=A0A919PNY6_9ACTN|nr:DUF397 domain-containing protein [Dactylosporangium siamense]GIG47459.1 hypothetical protein Dsi01nite_055000 [Dactylosporangium siamense]